MSFRSGRPTDRAAAIVIFTARQRASGHRPLSSRRRCPQFYVFHRRWRLSSSAVVHFRKRSTALRCLLERRVVHICPVPFLRSAALLRSKQCFPMSLYWQRVELIRAVLMLWPFSLHCLVFGLNVVVLASNVTVFRNFAQHVRFPNWASFHLIYWFLKILNKLKRGRIRAKEERSF